jgi:hypothetical protein
VHGSAVRLQVGGQRKVPTREQHSHPMVPKPTRDKHLIARPYLICAKGCAVRPSPHPRGGDVAAVGCAAFDNLGVTGNDAHPAQLGHPCHVGNDVAQLVDQKPFFKHERHRHPPRFGTHHREVVHCSADGKRADGTTRKPSWPDNERVGCHHQVVSAGSGFRHCKHCAVVGCQQLNVGEQRAEHVVDQRLAGRPACPVRHGDYLIGETRSRTRASARFVFRFRHVARTGIVRRCDMRP